MPKQSAEAKLFHEVGDAIQLRGREVDIARLIPTKERTPGVKHIFLRTVLGRQPAIECITRYDDNRKERTQGVRLHTENTTQLGGDYVSSYEYEGDRDANPDTVSRETIRPIDDSLDDLLALRSLAVMTGLLREASNG